jgi:hypothetical protein
MVSVFEPDEFVQYRPTLRMLTPGNTLKQTIREFIAYKHYFYGYPFFLYSAIVGLLPLKVTIGLGGIQWNYLVLRQMVSVLPMILAILLLVYLQTRNKSFIHSIPLLLFLLFIPAVVKNNTWWHPDSLVILFIALTFAFLDWDDFKFGKYFYLAAVSCGLAIGTKLIGLFFFLAIPFYILWGLKTGRIYARKALVSAFYFVTIMAVVFVLSNPFLLIPEERAFAFGVQKRQAQAMAFGWQVAYEKGPLAWLPVIQEYYGALIFNLFTIFTLVLGALRGQRKLLNVLILFWFVPFSLYVLFTIVIRPSHFLLPAALPVYSSLVVAFPIHFWGEIDRFSKTWTRRNITNLLLWMAGILIVGGQFINNLSWSLDHYRHMVNRETETPTVRFYSRVEDELSAIDPTDKPLIVLRDVRIYVEENDRYVIATRTAPWDYAYVEDVDPDVIVVWRQRIFDYTNEGVLENAKDYAQMVEVVRFYTDAREKAIMGYELLYEDEDGAVFVRLGLSQE